MVRKAILVWWDYWSAQEGVCRTAESAAVAEAAGSESLGHIHHQQRQNYIKTPDNTQSQAPTPTSASTFICRSHKSLLFDFPLKHFHQFHLPPSAFCLRLSPFAAPIPQWILHGFSSSCLKNSSLPATSTPTPGRTRKIFSVWIAASLSAPTASLFTTLTACFRLVIYLHAHSSPSLSVSLSQFCSLIHLFVG